MNLKELKLANFCMLFQTDDQKPFMLLMTKILVDNFSSAGTRKCYLVFVLTMT